jgi:hypothetical protein
MEIPFTLEEAGREREGVIGRAWKTDIHTTCRECQNEHTRHQVLACMRYSTGKTCRKKKVKTRRKKLDTNMTKSKKTHKDGNRCYLGRGRT